MQTWYSQFIRQVLYSIVGMPRLIPKRFSASLPIEGVKPWKLGLIETIPGRFRITERARCVLPSVGWLRPLCALGAKLLLNHTYQAASQNEESRSHLRQGLAELFSYREHHNAVFTGFEAAPKQSSRMFLTPASGRWVRAPQGTPCRFTSEEYVSPLAFLDRGFFFPESRQVYISHLQQVGAQSWRTGRTFRGGQNHASGASGVDLCLTHGAASWGSVTGTAAALSGIRSVEGMAQLPFTEEAVVVGGADWSQLNRTLTQQATNLASSASDAFVAEAPAQRPLPATALLKIVRAGEGSAGQETASTRVNPHASRKALAVKRHDSRLSYLPRSGAAWGLSGSQGLKTHWGLTPRSFNVDVGRQMLLAQQTQLDFDFKGLMGQFKQPQVRYRPGMATYWREYRRMFAKNFWAPWGRRQGTLTRYIARLRRVACFSYFRLTLLNVAALVHSSRVVPVSSVQYAASLVQHGWVLLNGQHCRNPLGQTYAGDVLCLGSFGAPLVNRIGMATFRFWPTWRSSQFHEGVLGYHHDTPAYLEVDELTRVVVVLFEPYDWKVLSMQPYPLLPFLTLKCYNWKYVI